MGQFASMKPADRLLRYGVGIGLANKAVTLGLSVTKIRTLSREDLVAKFRLSSDEAAELKKCVVRKAIDPDVADALLERSNHLCCICKGMKGGGVLLHHIEEYEVSQDNSYNNLAVLCPNDHDRAHGSGLSLSLTKEQIHRGKHKWEGEVQVANMQAAARAIRVHNEGIDYVNVKRIEEMCLARLGSVPPTTISVSLQSKKILGADRCFDEAYVRRKLSGGGYLFDYYNSSEGEHYRQLIVKLSELVTFADLSEAARSGIRKLKSLEGDYAYFIGGISSKLPKVPIDRSSGPIVFQHKARGVQIRWDGDPNYLMSMSAISRQGRVNRYIIYGHVRTVYQAVPKALIEVTASPLLIAQPAVSIDRAPLIARIKQWECDDVIERED